MKLSTGITGTNCYCWRWAMCGSRCRNFSPRKPVFTFFH